MKNPNNDFLNHIKLILNQNPIKTIISIFSPKILDFFNEPLMNKQATKFFLNTFTDMVNYRRQNNIVRNDFLNLLIELMDHGKLKDKDDDDKEVLDKNEDNNDRISLTEACAQSFIFFLAGNETASSTSTYCLYELAKNLEIQRKLQDEIDKFENSSIGLNYESIMNNMEYLNMVFCGKFIIL